MGISVRKADYLQLRGQTYYFRMAVPKELQSTLCRKELILSLRTQDRSAARWLALLVATRAMEMITTKDRNMTSIAQHQLDKLLQDYFNKIYDSRVIQRTVPWDKIGKEDALQIAHDDAAGIHTEFTQFKQDKLKAINELTTEAGLQPIAKGSPEHRYLQDSLYQADDHANELWMEKIRNPLTAPEPKGKFATRSASSILVQERAGHNNVGTSGEVTVSEMISIYSSHKSAKGRWRPDTVLDAKAKLAVFAEFIGPNRMIHSITPHDFKAYDDALSLMPRNMNKMAKYKKLTLREAAAKVKDGDVVTPQTASKHFDYVRWMFDHAVTVFYLERNSVPNFRKDTVYKKKERKPFTSEQLKQIFGSQTFNDFKFYKKSGVYWVPLLGAYTGARLNELVGLESADVIFWEGIHYLYIRPNDYRQLKSESSERLIPLHPDIIKAGFVKYAALQKTRNKKMLFSDLMANKAPADALTKRFANILKELRIKEGGDSSLCFHSLRHTFAGHLLEKGVTREIRMGLMGHTIPDTQKDYVHQFPVKLTNPELSKLDYGLDLETLLQVSYPKRTRKKKS